MYKLLLKIFPVISLIAPVSVRQMLGLDPYSEKDIYRIIDLKNGTIIVRPAIILDKIRDMIHRFIIYYF